MKEYGDQLLEHVLAGGNDRAESKLLMEFYRGYPIEKLQQLLASDQESAVKAGAWIASELGAKIAPLIHEIAQLLDHPSRYVRFFLLDAVLMGSTHAHGEIIASAVKLIQDRDEAVRWKAIRFLSNAQKEQLTASLPYLDSGVATRLSWLLENNDTQEVIARLQDEDSLTRLFAVAAAARLGESDLAPLKFAASSSADPEIRTVANKELRILS